MRRAARLWSYWFTAIALAIISSPIDAQQSDNPSNRQPSAEQGGSNRNGSPTQIAPAISRVADELAKTRNDQSDPYGDERNQRERDDLIAQQDSAFWARSNFWAMIAQTLLAAGALWAIVTDLKQSRASSETQTRAFVTVSDITYNVARSGEKRWWTVEVNLENQGATPAYISEFSYKVGIRRKGIAEDIMEHVGSNFRTTSFIIASGKPFCIRDNLSDTFNFQRLEIGDVLVITGEIIYSDIFKKRRKTQFRYVAEREVWVAGTRSVHADASMVGNTAD